MATDASISPSPFGRPLRSRGRRPAAAAVTLVALALAGCGGGDEGAGEPAAEAVPAAEVTIADFAYEPDPVTVQSGGTVTWTNEDVAPHTATATTESAPAEFDTDTLEQGDSAEVTLEEPGTYEYVCSFHATMNGTVEVVE